MTIRKIFGDALERQAIAYLESLGWQIVARNYRIGRGEIDCIARDGHILVFVEIRARRRAAMVEAAASVDYRKQQQIIFLAGKFYLKHIVRARNYDWAKEIRFDIIARNSGAKLEHLRGAFQIDSSGFRY